MTGDRLRTTERGAWPELGPHRLFRRPAGAVDSETQNDVPLPFATVSEDWSVTTLGLD